MYGKAHDDKLLMSHKVLLTEGAKPLCLPSVLITLPRGSAKEGEKVNSGSKAHQLCHPSTQASFAY